MTQISPHLPPIPSQYNPVWFENQLREIKAQLTTTEESLSNVEDITPQQYGAEADGDGSGAGTDNSIAFQSAVDAAANGVLLIPSGTYRIDSAITSTSKIHIKGQGKVVLDFTKIAGDTIALKIYGTSGGRLEEKVVLENIIIQGPEDDAVNGVTTTTTTGLHCEYLLGLRMVNVEVKKFYTGVYITESWPISDTDCKVEANYIGLELGDDCTFGSHINSRYLNNYFPLYLYGGITNQTFINCDFEGAGDNAITIDPNGDSIWSLQFINPYFEGIGGSAFLVRYHIDETASTGNVHNVLISCGIWSNITDYAINLPADGDIHSFTILSPYGIDNIASDVANGIRRSLLVGGNSSLTDGIYYWDNSRTLTRVITRDVGDEDSSSLNLYTDTIEISNAEIRTLAASPKELVAAPGSDKFIEFVSAVLIYDRSGWNFEEPTPPDDLAIEYDNGSGAQIATWDTTDLIEAGGDRIKIITCPDTGVLTASDNKNKNLVLINTGDEYVDNAGGTSTSTMTVKVTYRIHTLGL